jgi:hypothetical protein
VGWDKTKEQRRRMNYLYTAIPLMLSTKLNAEDKLHKLPRTYQPHTNYEKLFLLFSKQQSLFFKALPLSSVPYSHLGMSPTIHAVR